MSFQGFKRGLVFATPSVLVMLGVGTASMLLVKSTGGTPTEAIEAGLISGGLAYLSVYAGLRMAYFDTLEERHD